MSLLHDSGGSGMSAQLAKRKRGRPRKDSSLKQAHTPGSEGGRAYLSQKDNRTRGTECMVGKAVTGFIEAAFDSGFLLSVRIGNSNIHLRGVVFKPGHCVPITAENDVAPHAQMIRRSDVRFSFEKQGQSPGPGTVGVVRPKRKHAPLKAPAARQASDHGEADVHMAEPLSMLPPGRSIPAGQVFVAMQSHPSCQVAQGSQPSNDGLSNKGTSAVVQTGYPAPKTAITNAKTADAKESLKSSAGSSEQETKDSNEPFPNEFDYGVAWMTELLKAQENSQERQVEVAEHPTSASHVEFHGTATGELAPKNQAHSHDTSVPDPVISLAAVVPSNPGLERFGRIDRQDGV